ncbi:hypothetical protein [Pseudoalteromonas sp. PPB1]|uniref:hypothetical protein n=1 Tax=Pseudoalteromonas sp. PPB1 TaxID=2756136 RepID=UPI00189140B6|nr:hypothetical protein [Pseudoalteromonas sp. PPB1]
MGVFKKTAFLFVFVFLSNQSYAEPSKFIAQAMTAPASVFDLFLFKIEEQSKCYRGWFGNSKTKDHETPCLTTLKYNFDENIIKMNFFVGDVNEKMIGFKASNDKDKEAILRNVLSDLASTLGVEKNEYSGLKLGMIQMTSIRNGWSRDEFDESNFKEEVTKRTVITVTANIEDGFIYKAIRNHHGKVRFEKKRSHLKQEL